MVQIIGRNANSNDVATVTTYTLNSVTATVISLANSERMYFTVCLDRGSTDEDVAIRCYSAATDNVFRGEVLTRRTGGNDALFRPSWAMPVDNLYTGEVSAITDSGTMVVHVTEW